MPQAGDTIRALDFTAASQTTESGDLNNLSNTSFAAGSPACSTTFVAPTSGKVQITIYIQANADDTTNRLDVSYELRETDASGTVIVAASAGRAIRAILASSVSTNDGSDTYVDIAAGLTAGQTYYVQTMHQVSGGSDIDLTHREIAVVPLPA